MKGVCRFIYRSDLDREELLRKEYKPSFRDEGITSGDIIPWLDFILDGVSSDDDSAIVLEGFFSNAAEISVIPLNRYTHYNPGGQQHRGRALVVYPKYGRVEYKLSKNDFFANFSGDPLLVEGVNRWDEEDYGMYLASPFVFFRRNPFEHRGDYERLGKLLFEDWIDEEG